MSVKVMGWVWDQNLPQNEKFVLLAHADHADHDGYNIFPSIDLVAHKTGYSRRSVQRIVKRLVEKGYLIPIGLGPNATNRYKIPMPMGGDRMASPPEGVTTEAGGVTLGVDGGDTATTPKPSVNRQEPSVKRDSSDKHTEWDKFLLAWARHFPHKIQPRVNNLTLRKKLMVRLKDIYFRENYETALMQASGSDFVNSGNWMDAGWFLKNEENWEKCLDGKYDSNDKPKQISKQQTKKNATKQGLYAYLKKEGVIVDDT